MKSLLLIMAICGLAGGKPPLSQSVDLIELMSGFSLLESTEYVIGY
jgi:hypothetical protein